jgi:hypothetical protein
MDRHGKVDTIMWILSSSGKEHGILDMGNVAAIGNSTLDLCLITSLCECKYLDLVNGLCLSIVRSDTR